eukprot:Nitzschia sp. Nitz4//scaffold117_size69655//61096//62655//NITZ4_006030-RA/size69655-processed-gene-0.30-mRNA-1//1//CDS//3329533669//8464//frame0
MGWVSTQSFSHSNPSRYCPNRKFSTQLASTWDGEDGMDGSGYIGPDRESDEIEFNEDEVLDPLEEKDREEELLEDDSSWDDSMEASMYDLSDDPGQPSSEEEDEDAESSSTSSDTQPEELLPSEIFALDHPKWLRNVEINLTNTVHNNRFREIVRQTCFDDFSPEVLEGLRTLFLNTHSTLERMLLVYDLNFDIGGLYRNSTELADADAWPIPNRWPDQVVHYPHYLGNQTTYSANQTVLKDINVTELERYWECLQDLDPAIAKGTPDSRRNTFRRWERSIYGNGNKWGQESGKERYQSLDIGERLVQESRKQPNTTLEQRIAQASQDNLDRYRGILVVGCSLSEEDLDLAEKITRRMEQEFGEKIYVETRVYTYLHDAHIFEVWLESFDVTLLHSRRRSFYFPSTWKLPGEIDDKRMDELVEQIEELTNDDARYSFNWVDHREDSDDFEYIPEYARKDEKAMLLTDVKKAQEDEDIDIDDEENNNGNMGVSYYGDEDHSEEDEEFLQDTMGDDYDYNY